MLMGFIKYSHHTLMTMNKSLFNKYKRDIGKCDWLIDHIISIKRFYKALVGRCIILFTVDIDRLSVVEVIKGNMVILFSFLVTMGIESFPIAIFKKRKLHKYVD